MILVIKNKQYDNPDWRVEKGIGVLRIPSEKSFAEIVSDFSLSAGESIVQLNDSGAQIGEWYVEGMASIQLPGEDDSDVVTIKYHISQIGKEAQEALNDDLDMATLSVLELATMVTDAKKVITDTASRIEESQQEQGNLIKTLTNKLNTMTEQVARWENMYNTLADRVARLENKEA